jgi:hypothetical protein
LILKNKTILFLLLAIFLAPLAEKWIHHHHGQKFIFNPDNQYFKEDCPICNYEFVALSHAFQKANDQVNHLTDRYLFASVTSLLPETGSFSFSLRAPPLNKMML